MERWGVVCGWWHKRLDRRVGHAVAWRQHARVVQWAWVAKELVVAERIKHAVVDHCVVQHGCGVQHACSEWITLCACTALLVRVLCWHVEGGAQTGGSVRAMSGDDVSETLCCCCACAASARARLGNARRESGALRWGAGTAAFGFIAPATASRASAPRQDNTRQRASRSFLPSRSV